MDSEPAGLKRAIQATEYLFWRLGTFTAPQFAHQLGISRQGGGKWIKKLVRLGYLTRHYPDLKRHHYGPPQPPDAAKAFWPSASNPEFWRELLEGRPARYVELIRLGHPRLRQANQVRGLAQDVEQYMFVVLDFAGIEQVSEKVVRLLLLERPCATMPINMCPAVKDFAARVVRARLARGF